MWYLKEIGKKIWVRVVSFALLAFISAGIARVLSPYLPQEIALRVGADAVAALLEILTSSMLAVTTFSLSIAVYAYAVAASSGTPRRLFFCRKISRLRMFWQLFLAHSSLA
jgi:uncharacterized membrane protein